MCRDWDFSWWKDWDFSGFGDFRKLGFFLCASVPETVEFLSLTEPLGADLGKILVISEVAELQKVLGNCVEGL